MVQGWGRNNWGQSSVPSGLGSVKSVAAGGGHTCAIKTGNSLQYWVGIIEDKVVFPQIFSNDFQTSKSN